MGATQTSSFDSTTCGPFVAHSRPYSQLFWVLFKHVFRVPNTWGGGRRTRLDRPGVYGNQVPVTHCRGESTSVDQSWHYPVGVRRHPCRPVWEIGRARLGGGGVAKLCLPEQGVQQPAEGRRDGRAPRVSITHQQTAPQGRHAAPAADRGGPHPSLSITNPDARLAQRRQRS